MVHGTIGGTMSMTTHFTPGTWAWACFRGNESAPSSSPVAPVLPGDFPRPTPHPVAVRQSHSPWWGTFEESFRRWVLWGGASCGGDAVSGVLRVFVCPVPGWGRVDGQEMSWCWSSAL